MLLLHRQLLSSRATHTKTGINPKMSTAREELSNGWTLWKNSCLAIKLIELSYLSMINGTTASDCWAYWGLALHIALPLLNILQNSTNQFLFSVRLVPGNILNFTYKFSLLTNNKMLCKTCIKQLKFHKLQSQLYNGSLSSHIVIN